MASVKDRNGEPVEVRTKVRVLEIRSSVLERLSSTEQEQVLSMRGEVFDVYEIDQWGSAWVRKSWEESDGKTFSHSLALASHEMECVA